MNQVSADRIELGTSKEVADLEACYFGGVRMITCDGAKDVKLAGRSASLEIVRLSQALGDFQVLRERGQRVIRLHLEGDREAALRQLSRSSLEALT